MFVRYPHHPHPHYPARTVLALVLAPLGADLATALAPGLALVPVTTAPGLALVLVTTALGLALVLDPRAQINDRRPLLAMKLRGGTCTWWRVVG